MRLIRITTHITIIVVMFVGCATHVNNHTKEQSHRDEIDSLLKSLLQVDAKDGNTTITTAPSIQTQQDVHDSLLRIANQTSGSRSEVVEALLQVLEDPQAREESPIAYRWTIAVDVLGELKAVEAIDILIKNLDRTGQPGVCISLSYHPVARALAKIGEPAVPQLIEVLSSSSDEDIRSQAEVAIVNVGEPAIPEMQEVLYQGDARTRGRAALVLAWIGGKDTGTLIKDAMAREKDPEVLKKLKDALRELHSRWG